LESRIIAPIKVADDEELILVIVPITIGNKSTEAEGLVTRDITGQILGTDWMTRQGPITWDFQNS